MNHVDMATKIKFSNMRRHWLGEVLEVAAAAATPPQPAHFLELLQAAEKVIDPLADVLEHFPDRL